MKLKRKRSLSPETVQVIIMGAGGRDFHNFNTFFKNRPEYQVRDLEERVRKSVCNAVAIATPTDLETVSRKSVHGSTRPVLSEPFVPSRASGRTVFPNVLSEVEGRAHHERKKPHLKPIT